MNGKKVERETVPMTAEVFDSQTHTCGITGGAINFKETLQRGFAKDNGQVPTRVP